MYRVAVLVFALLFPSVAAAQQPCTTDPRQVVNELYRHMLERRQIENQGPEQIAAMLTAAFDRFCTPASAAQ